MPAWGCPCLADWRLCGLDCGQELLPGAEWSPAWASGCGRTHGVPAGGRAVWGPVDETPQRADSMGAHQRVAAEGPAVHHPDVQGRVQQLVLWKVLGGAARAAWAQGGHRGATPTLPGYAQGLHPPLQTT